MENTPRGQGISKRESGGGSREEEVVVRARGGRTVGVLRGELTGVPVQGKGQEGPGMPPQSLASMMACLRGGELRHWTGILGGASD